MRKHYETNCPGNPLNKDAAMVEYVLPILLGDEEEQKSEEDPADLEEESWHLSPPDLGGEDDDFDNSLPIEALSTAPTTGNYLIPFKHNIGAVTR